MAEPEPRENGVDARDLLREALAQYRTMFWLFQERIDAMKGGAEASETDTKKLLAGHVAAAQALLGEMRRVEQEDARRTGDGGGHVIDFDAMRAEIGRRLAGLRAHRDAGGVS